MMKFVYAGIFLLVLLGGCGQKNRPDVDKFLKDRKIIRLDKEVFSLDRKNPEVEVLLEKYKDYFPLYVNGVLRLGETGDPDFRHLFSLFLQDTIIREVYDSVAVKYPEMSVQEKDLSKAFAYYAYYFPSRIIPDVYAHISGFNQSIIVDSTAIGISLDNYLGEDCIFYSMLATPIPMYARKKMTQDDIVKDALSGWMSAEFIFKPQKNDLLSAMIYQGKIVYLLKKIFPEYEEQRLFGFSKEQLKWCEDNESRIWGFLIENEYLFSTQQRIVMKYISDAPFTSGMPVESPGRVVVWTGEKIVEAYMEKSDVGLDELMNEQDYHKILKIAGYRP